MNNTVEELRINRGLWEENCLRVEVCTGKETFKWSERMYLLKKPYLINCVCLTEERP